MSHPTYKITDTHKELHDALHTSWHACINEKTLVDNRDGRTKISQIRTDMVDIQHRNGRYTHIGYRYQPCI